MRFIFGGEPVSINRYGVGVMVDRYFVPDAWEGEPFRLVLIERKKKTLAIAVSPSDVRQAPIDLVPMSLVQKAWEFMERRSGGRKESTMSRVSVGEMAKEVGMMLTDLEQEIDSSAEWFSVVKDRLNRLAERIEQIATDASPEGLQSFSKTLFVGLAADLLLIEKMRRSEI